MWGLKRVNSKPFNLTGSDFVLSKHIADRTRMLLKSDTSTNDTENLWKTTENQASKKSEPYIRKYIISRGKIFFLGKWQPGKTYRFHVSHHPHKQTMRVKLWEDGVMLFDTKDVVDTHRKALHGGRLGVYFLGATKATFSKLSYR